MEHSIVDEVGHESISLMFMEKINKEFNGSLTLAIQVFKGEYHRNFLHQLISGQLDMDRLDYLKRDSFYTGVAEGNINSERLISMLYVIGDELVVEEKGVYSVEKFLLSRRLMYWQVYLHKTSLVAENLLIRVLKRAKELVEKGVRLNASKALSFFLENKITAANFTEQVLEDFYKLDDYDIIAAVKEWTATDDFVLSNLCTMIIDRDLLKIKIKNKAFAKGKGTKHIHKYKEQHQISEEEAHYFVFTGTISNQAYHENKQNIKSAKISAFFILL